MSSNHNSSDGIDVLLDKLHQLPVPADVEQRLDAQWDAFCGDRTLGVQLDSELPQNARGRRVWKAVAVVSLAVILPFALFVTFGGNSAWGEVVKSVRSRPWVRVTCENPPEVPDSEETRGISVTWYSAAHGVFASRFDRQIRFVNLARKEAYDYDLNSNVVDHSMTDDLENDGTQYFAALLRLLSVNERSLSFLQSPIEILERTRHEVAKGDERWSEFSFLCRGAHVLPSEYRMTFLVDPRSQLPVEMRIAVKSGADHSEKESTFTLDYPDSGPQDVYAMDVPRDAKVVDRRQAISKDSNEIKSFLAAYVRARDKSIESYSVTAFESVPEKNFSDIVQAYRGKGGPDESTFEVVDYQELFELRKKYWAGEIKQPDDIDKIEWWKEQIQGLKFGPRPRAGELLPDRAGYPTELLTMGRSPVDNPDCQITLDRKPTKGPRGTVLLKIRTETTIGFNDCFYWIDPAKDYLVLRYEIHFSKDHAAWNNSTRVIDKVEQSPSGRWYVTAMRNGRIEKHGDDLSAKSVNVVNSGREISTTGMEMGPVTTTVYRSLVEFEAK